jgi:hypothetical protein
MPETLTIREICEMHFDTSLGGKRVIRVPDPAAGIAETTVRTAASRLIAANPFDNTVGSLTSLQRADIVLVSRNRLV